MQLKIGHYNVIINLKEKIDFSQNPTINGTHISSLESGTAYGNYLFWDGIGFSVGNTEVRIGSEVAETNQGPSAIAIGYHTASDNQGSGGIAIGSFAGQINQGSGGNGGIAIGSFAGQFTQQNDGIAIGAAAGQSGQGSGIAIGAAAGQFTQQTSAIAIGAAAGQSGQYENSIAIGKNSAIVSQGTNCVSVGFNSGAYYQGDNAIALGNSAGFTGQVTNSIILNASNTPLNGTDSGLYINPIRSQNFSYILGYDPLSKEILYNDNGYLNIISVIDNYTANITDYYISVNTNSFSITIDLPSNPGNGKVFIIKDTVGNAAVNNITITTIGNIILFDGAAVINISSNYGSVRVVFDNGFYSLF
jgi:hypothetical protein